MALVQTGVRVPDDLFRRAKVFAIEHDMKLQDVFTEALRDYLAKHSQSGE